MEFNVSSWLDDLGLTGDDRATALKMFGDPERVKKLEASHARQSDYSRAMNALKDQETALQARIEAAEADLEGERGTLVTWRTTAEGKLTAAETARDAAERKLFDTQQLMRKLAEEHGVDPATLKLEEIDDPSKNRRPDPAAETVAVDEKLNQFGTQVRQSVVGVAKLTATLTALNAQHRKLFGEDIPDAEAIVDQVLEGATKGKPVDIKALWETRYKVPERRQALADEAFNKRVDDEVVVRMAKARDDEALGVRNPSDLPGSPILQKFGKAKNEQDTRPRHNGETGADAARKAFRDGKHRKEAIAISRAALAG